MLEVLDLDPGSTVHLALQNHGYDNIINLTSMSDDDIDLLSYHETDANNEPLGDSVPLARGRKGLLKNLKAFIAYKMT